MLNLKNFSVQIEDKLILENIELKVDYGTMHVIMGPNGSGKSSFAYSLIGHPNYTVTNGTVVFEHQDLLDLSTEKRARSGLFLAYQYPISIPGVQVFTFLRESHRMLTGQDISIKEFENLVFVAMQQVGLDKSFINRYLNEGFSGGERKRLELLQMLLFKPKLAILDEIDSGLDIDGLKIVTKIINLIRKNNPETSIILITHYQRILEEISVDYVHILQNGRLIKSGNYNLAKNIEINGYDKLQI